MEKEGQEESGLEKVCGSMVGNDQLPIGDNTFREKEMGQKETGGDIQWAAGKGLGETKNGEKRFLARRLQYGKVGRHHV